MDLFHFIEYLFYFCSVFFLASYEMKTFDGIWHWISNLFVGGELVDLTLGQRILIIFLIVLLAWLVDWICRRVICPLLQKMVAKTSYTWDDHLFNSRVLDDICHLVPAFIVYMLMPLAFVGKPMLGSIIVKVSYIYIITVTLRLIFSIVNSLYALSAERERNRNRPLKGIFQMIKVMTVSVGVIFIFSVILDKSPIELFVGLGAAATVLLLVFKDTIVGLVSGVQLSANDMLRPGDWICMPKYGVDGVVFEVNLITVKVRNWDNTIVTVPPYSLVSDSFQNWRGMFEGGGRRIKRSIPIDMSTVRFCTGQELEKYRKMGLVTEDDKVDELTNFTMFRRALLKYLHAHPCINHELTTMVRQLQPTSQGIPLELYFFSTDKQWVAYETLQADIFDYVLAVVPQYGLGIFQLPSGDSFVDK